MSTGVATMGPTSVNPLRTRGLKPIHDLAAYRPHGDRLRYLAGCRCSQCRKANSAYERDRQQARAVGDWNGLVDATPAKAHLLQLAAAGVGRRAVAAATDISHTTIQEIRAGTRLRIRALSARKILAVTPAMASDHALVDARPTWRLVQQLQNAGFSTARIARAMGYNGSALLLGKTRVTARNAARMVLAHAQLMASDEVEVSAAPSLRRIARLREEGFTDKQLARFLELPDGNCAIPARKLPRALEKRITDLYEHLMN